MKRFRQEERNGGEEGDVDFRGEIKEEGKRDERNGGVQEGGKEQGKEERKLRLKGEQEGRRGVERQAELD